MRSKARSEVGAALGKCAGSFAMTGVFSLVINLLVLASPLYMMQVFDRVLSSGRVETLLMLTLIAGFALLILGGLVLTRGVAYYVKVTLAIVVLGGLGLWVLGRSAAHIGASGVAFGYFGFLVARGRYERRLGSIAAAVLVIAVYGGMLGGVLPRADGVSWEGHLCGLLAGWLYARPARGRKR